MQKMYLICFVLAVTTITVTNAVSPTPPPLDEHWPCSYFPSATIDLNKITGDYYLAHFGALNQPKSDLDANGCTRLHLSHPSSEIVQFNFTHKSPAQPLSEDGRQFQVYKGKTGRWVPLNYGSQASVQALTDDMILIVICRKSDPSVMRNVIYSRWKEITPQRKEEIWKVIRTTNMQFHQDAVIDTHITCVNELPASKF